MKFFYFLFESNLNSFLAKLVLQTKKNKDSKCFFKWNWNHLKVDFNKNVLQNFQNHDFKARVLRARKFIEVTLKRLSNKWWAGQ